MVMTPNIVCNDGRVCCPSCWEERLEAEPDTSAALKTRSTLVDACETCGETPTIAEDDSSAAIKAFAAALHNMMRADPRVRKQVKS